MKNVNVWDQPTQGEVPALKGLFGKRVYRAWAPPSKFLLILKLEGGHIVSFEGLVTDIPNRMAIEVTMGDERPGADWDAIDRACPQTPYLKELRGRRLTGLDGCIVEFDEYLGAKITPHGIEWVKRAED